jgi:hypothetical protein
VRFVLANPSDPSRLNEFNDWYDTYSAALTVPGYLANDIHFENPDASGGNTNPRYATIYDIVAPDPATAWPDTEHSPAYPTQLLATRAPSWSPQPCAPPTPSPAPSSSWASTARSPAFTSSSPTAAATPNASTGRPRSCKLACSTPPPDSGSSKDPPSQPNGSRYSRPTTPTPPYLPASDQLHAARIADPAPAKRVVPPGWCPQNPMARELNTRERQLCVTIAGQKPSRRATQRHPASEPVIRTWIPGRSPSSSTGCPPPTHVNRGREVSDDREFPARYLQSG